MWHVSIRAKQGPARLGLIVLALGLCGVAHPLAAQVQTDTAMTGAVSDSSGAVIHGAVVSLKDENTGELRTTPTNSSGAYSFMSIPPGTYTLRVSIPGFKTAEITHRVAQVGQPAQADFVLEVGESAQTVTVSAAGAELINTTTAEVSGSIDRELVGSLPLNGQDFMDLAAMTPGSARVDALGTWTNNGSNQASFTEAALQRVSAAGLSMSGGVFLGGNRDSASNISIDGSNVQLAHQGETVQKQSPADIEQVKVESGVMNAEFGFGAAAVNIVTRSGTNRFHGEAYEFLRNDNLDATNFFTNLARQKNPEYKMNQFGAAVGGPVIRNKLHFFANYEGLRVLQRTVSQGATPPANIRTGDFSTLGRFDTNGNPTLAPIIYNPYQYDAATGLRQPFPGNRIPQSVLDRSMVAYLKYTPLPNTVIDGIPVYVATPLTSITSNQYTGRMDWEESAHTHIFGRLTHFQNYAVSDGLTPIQGTENPYGSTNPTVSWVQILSSAAVNDLHLSYTRGNWGNARASKGFGDVSSEIGLKNTAPGAGGPSITVGDFVVANSLATASATVEDTVQLKDDFSVLKGRHSLKFGFQANDRRVHYNSTGFDKGTLTFQNIFTTACPVGKAACTAARTAEGLAAGGSGFADYLLGAIQDERLSVPGAKYNAVQRYYGAYAQDSWRIFPRLTLNLGVRYEYWGPWLNIRRMAVRWDGVAGNVVYALRNPLDYLSPATHFGRDAAITPGESPAGYTTGRNNFAPRGGLAYLLTSSTAIRAGAGIYFDGNADQNQFSSIQSAAGPFGLFLQNTVVGNEATPPYLAANQFPVPPPTAIAQPSLTNPISARILGSNYYPTPTVYEWSFSVQQRLGKSWSIESAYLGTHTIREPQYLDMNIPNLPQGPLANASMQDRRLFPGWGAIQTWYNLGWAKYNAVTTSVKAPSWHGLTLLSWFTFSRDIASGELGKSSTGNIDPRAFDMWAGPTLLNPNLRNVNSWSYELPFGKGRRFSLAGPSNWVLGGWKIAGSAEFAKGGHQAVYTAADNSGTAQSYPMANRICDGDNVPGGKSRLAWFNTACFPTPAFGTYGNSPLGVFVEPGTNNWKTSIQKVFRIPKTEAHRVEFRTDLFNAFNHTQWGYVTNVNLAGSVSSGRVGAAHPARQIQLSMKYLF